MAITIAILSQKGGTGKTTLTRSLAAGLSLAGLGTLAIDSDPQGNLSEYFGVPADAYPTLGEVLTGRETAMDAIARGGILPANLGLAEAELILAGKSGRELTLRNALREPKRHFDVILIDCPPTLGLLTVNALAAADRAILSSEAEHFSKQGAEQAMKVASLARDNLNPSLELLGVLLNIADMRTGHARETLDLLRWEFGDLVFDTVVRRSIAYPESARAGQSIFDFDRPRALDYASLTVEVLDRLGLEDALGKAKGLLREIRPAEGKTSRKRPSGSGAKGKRKAPGAEPKPAPAAPKDDPPGPELTEWAWVESVPERRD